MEKNIKLFPIYKLFSYDILFYYAISVVFFSEVKGLALSQIALLTTAYSVSSIIFQIPSAIIADKIGTKRCMIFGNIICTLWGVNLIVNNSFTAFIFGEFLLGTGFALKGVSESPFLLSSLKKIGRGGEFSKIESKGSVLYFLIEAIACAISGYLYTANPYLPIIFAATCCLIATIISLNFTKIRNSDEKISTKKYFSDLNTGFKFIFKSKRLNAMLLFCAIFYGIICMCNIYTKSYFAEYKLTATGFGYVYAAFAICSALGSKVQNTLEKRHKNKTLTFFSISYSTLLLLIGIISLFNLDSNALINIGVVLFSIQNLLKGAYRIIIKAYITRYTTSTIRSKLMSIYYLSEQIGASALSFTTSLFLAKFTVGTSIIISSFVIIILTVISLEFMATRVGLSPDKYTEKDRYDLKQTE